MTDKHGLSERANVILDKLRNSGADVDTTVWVSAASLAKLLADGEHLRQQVTNLQADNTRLHLKAEAARNENIRALADRDEARRERDAALANSAEANARLAHLGLVLDTGSVGLESVGQAAKRVVRERDHLREANRNLLANYRTANEDRAAAQVVSNAFSEQRKELHEERVKVTRERDVAEQRLAAAMSDRERFLVERNEARAALAAASDIPPELARLWRAARGAQAKWGSGQFIKLAEECAEYLVEVARPKERQDDLKTITEAHDVLTVALSLADPALMAKSAERLEARLK